MQRIGPSPPQGLLFREAGELIPALIAVVDATLGKRRPDDLRNRLGQKAEASFSVARGGHKASAIEGRVNSGRRKCNRKRCQPVFGASLKHHCVLHSSRATTHGFPTFGCCCNDYRQGWIV